jgi:mannosylglucosylglycerate synthase
MNIGFVATRLAGVDGVSLETSKMVKILKQMGHDCFYCAGEMDSNSTLGRVVPRMGFNDSVIMNSYNEAFRTIQPASRIFKRIHAQADMIREEIMEFIEDYKIDLLVSQNASTIPLNLPLGVAIRDLVERTRIPTICHHHDFYWERDRFMNNGIQDILDSAFPPKQEPIQHLVISSIMQRRLLSWYGIQAQFLPNVFDFDASPPQMDDYALSFRKDMGLSDDDLIILQPTRVVRRKAIEKSIELVRKLDDPRLILLITGYEGDEPGGYGVWLREEAERSGIRYRFIADYVGTHRGEQDGHKVYTLWDIYPHAHIVAYPSTYEGFGNALIETIYFSIPFVVHTYPAYLADIKPAGIRAVEFYHDITDDVLESTRKLIDDADYRWQMVEHNYAIGKEHFSYKCMRDKMELMLSNIM